MNTEQVLQTRSESKCELCGSEHSLSIYDVPLSAENDADHAVLICEVCQQHLSDPSSKESEHWRCLSDAMWSPVPAVQVVAWRQLNQLAHEAWAQNLLDMMYLDDETKIWAEAISDDEEDSSSSALDSNGALLVAGDSITLIKDLEVKGANFTAKRGTLVKNISLTNNPEQIEGKVNGTRIVLLTKFLKKA